MTAQTAPAEDAKAVVAPPQTSSDAEHIEGESVGTQKPAAPDSQVGDGASAPAEEAADPAAEVAPAKDTPAKDTPAVAPPKFAPSPTDHASADVCKDPVALGSSVVRLQVGLSDAVATYFYTRRHLITSWSAVKSGRGLRIIDDQQHEYPVKVVAKDEEHNLALLIIPTGEGAAASHATVQPSLVLPKPAARVLTISHSKAHKWSFDRGTLSDVDEDSFRVNASVSTGSPVLDCEGRLLGVVGDASSRTGAGATHIRGLVRKVGEPQSILGPTLSIVGSLLSDGLLWGAQVTARGTLKGTFGAQLDVGGAVDLWGTTGTRQNAVRIALSGFGVALVRSLSLKVLVGGGAAWIRRVERFLAWNPDALQLVEREVVSSDIRLMLTLRLQYRRFEVGYSADLDFSDGVTASHWLSVGFAFY